MRYVTHKRGEDDYQDLVEHLNEVSTLATGFAEPFGAGDQARRMGLLHDIGKYGKQAQRRQIDPEHAPKCDHSTAGAKVALANLQDAAAAFAIAGHHTGLQCLGSVGDKHGSLLGRIANTEINDADIQAWKTEVDLPNIIAKPYAFDFAFAFFVRMMFSCLVDADYLDTSAFMNRKRVEPSRCTDALIAELCEKLKAYVKPWLDAPKGELGEIRNEILKACMEHGTDLPGIFSLTVPTGGGKTIASMMFALIHAAEHHKKRIIYVVPYTSIIEQNADVFAGIFGKENVLEHHSNVDLSKNTEDEISKHKLAAENWDSPIIVTTAVQFFESLFSSKPSKCRKLHNISDSVIVFDEAQMLPVPYLRPCVKTIAELVKSYGVTAVLCTATQPALNRFINEDIPNIKITELCPDAPGVFHAMRRVTFKKEGKMSDEDAAQALNERNQGLCIVGSRKRAKRIYDLLKGEGCFHLSALMTPNHRRRAIQAMRERLINGLPCRVVSTSLIEAGVDIDFPEVWREMAGLDSILQAAGRCNREGKRPPEECVVHVFECEGADGAYKLFEMNRAAAREIDRKGLDYYAPETATEYFKRLYTMKTNRLLDEKNVLDELNKLDFRKADELFEIIDKNMITVYIPNADNAQDMELLRSGEVSRELMRRLGSDAVSVYPNELKTLCGKGVLMPDNEDGYAVLADDNAYSAETGLDVFGEE